MAEHTDALAWGMAAWALRADLVGGVRFLPFILEVAHQAAAADPQQPHWFARA
jgi:hypothetical protein